MRFKDYYDVLGVKADASDADIKAAYRKLARKYHPDVSKEKDAESRFKDINEAYEALREPERRKAYDQAKANGFRAGDEFRPGPGGGGFEFDMGDAGNGQFSDFFESLFGRMRGGLAMATVLSCGGAVSTVLSGDVVSTVLSGDVVSTVLSGDVSLLVSAAPSDEVSDPVSSGWSSAWSSGWSSA